MRLGGFYRVPGEGELRAFKRRLEWAREAALETIVWVADFEFPELDQPYPLVSLRHPGEYPIARGRLVSDRGLNITASEFEAHIREEHVEHSNALHAVLNGHGAFLVGPQARYSLNFDRLSPLAQDAARDAGLGPVCRNPFRSIIVRAVEILYACDEAIRLIDGYRMPDRPYCEVAPRAATGYGWSEAPRGLLYHRYTLDDEGLIHDCTIVPPTSQNQKSIEADLRKFVENNLTLPGSELQWRCEQAIRNYDPCISCATHFLSIHLEED